MRSLVAQTQRYPLVTLGWNYESNRQREWEEAVIQENFFSRFCFVEESLTDTSPEAIILQAQTADIDRYLAEEEDISPESLEDIDYILEKIDNNFSQSPSKSQIQQLIETGKITTGIELEKWLFDWQMKNVDRQQIHSTLDFSYQDWFEPNDPFDIMALMLLPTTNSWDSLAYLHWYGSSYQRSPITIAFLKQWYQLYQAELVCHYGTMLQFYVNNPPTTPETAFELAKQQIALAFSTTFPLGVSPREHASALLYLQQWFIHERP